MKKAIIILTMAICHITGISQEKGTLTDPRDGKVYKSIKIGSQVWMAQNLTFKTNGGYWAYENKDTNAVIYGYLYNFETAKNVCPAGWHLPGKEEFKELLNNAAHTQIEVYDALIRNGSSGFSALLGGMRLANGNFINMDYGATFWSNSTWYLYLNSENPVIMNQREANIGSGLGASLGFSVRCLQDK